jgi:predicted  nucleic acid-binding Zn-ribbon protein
LTSDILRDEGLLQEKRRLHAEKQQELSQKLARFDTGLAEVAAEYDQLVVLVDAVLMQKFKSLSRKLPQPVAKLENGVCGGCRRSIPTTQMTLTQTTLVYCDNCGRLLLTELP